MLSPASSSEASWRYSAPASHEPRRKSPSAERALAARPALLSDHEQLPPSSSTLVRLTIVASDGADTPRQSCDIHGAARLRGVRPRALRQRRAQATPHGERCYESVRRSKHIDGLLHRESFAE